MPSRFTVHIAEVKNECVTGMFLTESNNISVEHVRGEVGKIRHHPLLGCLFGQRCRIGIVAPAQEEQALHLIEPARRLLIETIIGLILADDPASLLQETLRLCHRLREHREMMEGTIEDNTINMSLWRLPGVHIRTEIAQAAKPRRMGMSGAAPLGYLYNVWRHIDANHLMVISGQLKGEVVVATADLHDRLRRVGEHAFHELVGVERAQLDQRDAAPLEPLARIEVRVSDGMSQVSDEVRRKGTHAFSPLSG